MMIYTRARFKPKKKRKPKGVVATKYRRSSAILGVEQLPSLSYGSRIGADSARQIASLHAISNCTGRTSVMDAAQLAKETEEVRAEIIAKSKRIAIAYNKGAYQYVSDESDAKTIGRKNPV